MLSLPQELWDVVIACVDDATVIAVDEAGGRGSILMAFVSEEFMDSKWNAA